MAAVQDKATGIGNYLDTDRNIQWGAVGKQALIATAASLYVRNKMDEDAQLSFLDSQYGAIVSGIESEQGQYKMLQEKILREGDTLQDKISKRRITQEEFNQNWSDPAKNPHERAQGINTLVATRDKQIQQALAEMARRQQEREQEEKGYMGSVRRAAAQLGGRPEAAGYTLQPVADKSSTASNNDSYKAMVDAYQSEAREMLEAVGNDPIKRNQIITAAYAQLNLDNPDEFLWAGLAAFASNEVGFGIRDANDPGESIPLVCQDWANTKAAYRFLANDRVSEADILAGHFGATRARFAASEGPILVLHDTTEFSYKREDIEAVGITRKGVAGASADGRLRHYTACGILMHSSLVVTTDGLPLGIAAIKFWTRQKFKGTNALKKKINPTRVPIEEKESIRWLDNLTQSTKLLAEPQRCVHIGDRESDIYELFCAAHEAGTHLSRSTCVDRLAGDGTHTIRRRDGRSTLQGATSRPGSGSPRQAVRGRSRIEIPAYSGATTHWQTTALSRLDTHRTACHRTRHAAWA